MTRLSITLFFALVLSALGDTLTLRSGESVAGSWVGMDARDISFQVGGAIKKYPRSDVSMVTFEPAPAQAVAPPSPPEAPRKKVELGMTKAEVDAILGPPDEVLADLPAKQIYRYGKMKATFQGGRVADIQ